MNNAELRSAVPSSRARNPFVGLRPFQTGDSLYFFGRREQTLELLERLHDSRFVGVVGRSGCGKSSLVRAGLIPALEAGFLVGDRHLWRVITLTPGSAPLRKLANALLRTAEDSAPTTAEMHELYARGVRAQAKQISEILNARPGLPQNVLLIVDQFEEVFEETADASTPTAEAWAPLANRNFANEAQDFVSLLLDLPKADPSIFTVLTMRSDFLGECDRFSGLPEALNASRYLVPRLTRDQLRVAIMGPARVEGAEIEPRLLDRLLNDLGDRPEQLPVLQHALLRTWREYLKRTPRNDAPVVMEDYVSTGTLSSALSRHASEAYKPSEAMLVSAILKCLTDTDPRRRRIRRAATIASLEKSTGATRAEISRILGNLRSDERYFVTFDAESDSERIELSHESLIQVWPDLERWVDQERDARDALRDLVSRSQHWVVPNASERIGDLNLLVRLVLGRPQTEGYLQGADLARFQAWEQVQHPTKGWASRYVAEEAFVKAELYLDLSGEASSRAIRVSRVFRVVMGSLAAILTLGALVGWTRARHERMNTLNALHSIEAATRALSEQQDQANTQRARAREAGLVPAALNSTDAAIQVALLREAKETSSAVWIDAALSALQEPITELIFRHGGAREIGLAASNNTGSVFAAVADKKVRVWTDESTFIDLDAKDALVNAIAVSPDGSRVATANGDKKVRVWEVPKLSPQILDYENGATALAFGPGNLLAAGASDGSVRVWNPDGSRVRAFMGANEQTGGTPQPTTTLAFDSSGSRLAVARGRVLRIEDVRGRSPGRSLGGPEDSEISGVAFSVDGKLLAAGVGMSVKVWSTAGIRNPRVLRGHEGSVLSVAFSPDNKYLVTGARDDTARVWTIDGSEPPVVLRGHERAVTQARFVTDSRHVVTVSLDGTERSWNTIGRGAPTVLDAHSGAVRAVAFGPGDSPEIATGSWDKVAHIWAPPYTVPRLTLRHKAPIWSLSFDASGHHVVTGSLDTTAVIWDVHGGAPPIVLQVGRPVLAVSFSEDGTHVAVAGHFNGIEVYGADGSGPQRLLDKDQTPNIALYTVAYATDGHTIAAAGDDSVIRVFDTRTPGTVRVLTGHEGPVWSVAFDPLDGNLLSSSSDQTIRVWDLSPASDGKSLPIGTHGEVVDSIAVSPDGIIATGSWENTLRLRCSTKMATYTPGPKCDWNVVRHGHGDRVRAVAFDQSGNRVVTGSDDGTARVWGLLSPEAIRAALWESTKECLRPSQRAAMLGETDDEATRDYDACLQNLSEHASQASH